LRCGRIFYYRFVRLSTVGREVQDCGPVFRRSIRPNPKLNLALILLTVNLTLLTITLLSINPKANPTYPNLNFNLQNSGSSELWASTEVQRSVVSSSDNVKGRGKGEHSIGRPLRAGTTFRLNIFISFAYNDPHDSAFQTASRSVQPFLHSSQCASKHD